MKKLHDIYKKPGYIIATISLYLGVILIYFGFDVENIIDYLRNNGLSILGVLITFVSLGYLIMNILGAITPDKKFSDVDDASRQTKRFDILIDKVLSDLENVRTKQKIDVNKLRKELQDARSSANVNYELIDNFPRYFSAMANLITEKSNIADQKASILLDRGVSYTRFGIIYFIVSIVGWQVYAYLDAFKTEMIFGIVSTSLLFIFIEFLSAWFLKQYRHFIDTSTYLIKVKSIFDRYMLCYLTINQYPSSANGKSKADHLLKLLAGEIKWPDEFLIKNKDISFAKETMESMTEIIRSLKEARSS